MKCVTNLILTIFIITQILFSSIKSNSQGNENLKDFNDTLFSESPVVKEELINEINSSNLTWRAGVNKKFIGQKIGDAKKLLGLLPLENDNKRYQERKKKQLLKNIVIRNDLPESFDLREHYPKCETIKEIRDQSTCSSCWAFGAAEAMSDRICINSNQKLTNIRISPEDVLACCPDCGIGCRGGYSFEAWDYFRDNGVVTGGNYQEKGTCKPYSFRPCDHGDEKGSFGPCNFDVETPKCTKECDNDYDKSYEEDKWYGSDSYSLYGGEKQMMAEIYEKGSIEVGYSVYEDFFSYKSGVYIRHSGNYLGGHAAKCIGWGVENGTPYWLIANSWNTEWGENGFFKILRGNDHCGIESSVDTGSPDLKRYEERINRNKEFLKYLIE